MKSNVTQFAYLLDDITKDVTDSTVLSDRLRSFVTLASRYNMLYKLDSLLDEYLRIVRKRKGLVHVLVRSAKELSKAQQKEIQTIIPKQSDIDFQRDPSLQYGIQISVDDTVFDSSLSGRLTRLQRLFS
jgi:F0F1-type ATP synthase delta subunit